MPAVDFTTPLPPLVIGASGLEAIAQNIRVIVTTPAWSVPLDRAFAHAGAFIDAPTPYAVARKIAELTEAIEANEPLRQGGEHPFRGPHDKADGSRER